MIRFCNSVYIGKLVTLEIFKITLLIIRFARKYYEKFKLMILYFFVFETMLNAYSQFANQIFVYDYCSANHFSSYLKLKILVDADRLG